MMRETLSLLRLYHWRESLWNGHYRQLIKWWGWGVILPDTWQDVKIRTGARLAIHWRSASEGGHKELFLWSWQKMPPHYRWF